jgi:hypothetical protein
MNHDFPFKSQAHPTAMSNKKGPTAQAGTRKASRFQRAVRCSNPLGAQLDQHHDTHMGWVKTVKTYHFSWDEHPFTRFYRG